VTRDRDCGFTRRRKASRDTDAGTAGRWACAIGVAVDGRYAGACDAGSSSCSSSFMAQILLHGSAPRLSRWSGHHRSAAERWCCVARQSDSAAHPRSTTLRYEYHCTGAGFPNAGHLAVRATPAVEAGSRAGSQDTTGQNMVISGSRVQPSFNGFHELQLGPAVHNIAEWLLSGGVCQCAAGVRWIPRLGELDQICDSGSKWATVTEPTTESQGHPYA
jgi:hypothetical protein